MGRVAGVFDNPPGFPCTSPGVDILEGGKQLEATRKINYYKTLSLALVTPIDYPTVFDCLLIRSLV